MDMLKYLSGIDTIYLSNVTIADCYVLLDAEINEDLEVGVYFTFDDNWEFNFYGQSIPEHILKNFAALTYKLKIKIITELTVEKPKNFKDIIDEFSINKDKVVELSKRNNISGESFYLEIANKLKEYKQYRVAKRSVDSDKLFSEYAKFISKPEYNLTAAQYSVMIAYMFLSLYDVYIMYKTDKFKDLVEEYVC